MLGSAELRSCLNRLDVDFRQYLEHAPDVVDDAGVGEVDVLNRMPTARSFC